MTTPTHPDAPSPAPALLLVAALAAAVAAVLGLIVLLELPLWYGAVFLGALPLYWLALRGWAHLGRRRWRAECADLIDKGADRFQAPTLEAAPALTRRWFPPHALLLDVADLYAARGHADASLRFVLKALAATPPRDRHTLALRAWELLRTSPQLKLPDAERVELLKQLTTHHPAPRAEWHEHLGVLMLDHHHDAEAAERHLQIALALAGNDPGRRFKLCCLLALTAASAGRFGGAEAWMTQAHDTMPSGDPGYQAFYGRMLRKVDHARRFRTDAVINLRELIEGPRDAPIPDHLPEAPDDY